MKPTLRELLRWAKWSIWDDPISSRAYDIADPETKRVLKERHEQREPWPRYRAATGWRRKPITVKDDVVTGEMSALVKREERTVSVMFTLDNEEEAEKVAHAVYVQLQSGVLELRISNPMSSRVH